jgi:hypothetical protein
MSSDEITEEIVANTKVERSKNFAIVMIVKEEKDVVVVVQII